MAELPLSYGEIVMAQWATGQNVTRWSAALATYLAPPRADPGGR